MVTGKSGQCSKSKAHVENEVLLRCRRRCCVCFGLYRDGRVKRGQIAHLFCRKERHELEDLAFLCLDHHDQYDSMTSQSKKLTANEIRVFRNELEGYIQRGVLQEI